MERQCFEHLPDAAMCHLRGDSRYTTSANTLSDRDRTKREAVLRTVRGILRTYDSEHNARSFSGWPGQLGEYYVVPVLQFPEELFRRFRRCVTYPRENTYSVPPSFIHAAIEQVLDWAYEEIREDVPGGGIMGKSPPPEEMVQKAATMFLYAPARAIGDNRFAVTSLFGRLNSLSTWMYEGTEGTGRLLLSQPTNKAVNMTLSFALLCRSLNQDGEESCSSWSLLTCIYWRTRREIWGLGRLAEKFDPWQTQDVFAIDFLDRYYWRLVCGDHTLLECKYAMPTLPSVTPSLDIAERGYSGTFPTASERSAECFMRLYKAASGLDHGSMLVVAQDAEREAKRLEQQGTRIQPVPMMPELFRHVSRIDGSVLVDPDGMCHAIGVVLDGRARSDCLPARGARYNSAVRYVHGAAVGRLAVVVSDDGTVDVIRQEQ